MSLGYGWVANLVEYDDDMAAYSYRTYDFSLPCGEDGYGISEDDGLIWVSFSANGKLEFELEKASKYCNDQGLYSAKHLFLQCALSIKRYYEKEGILPTRVSGNI